MGIFDTIRNMIDRSIFLRFFIILVIVGIFDYAAHALSLYWVLPWFDVLMHFISGSGVAFLLLSFYKFVRVGSFKRLFIKVCLWVFIIGVAWEIYEYALGITSFAQGIDYVTDTASDLIMDVCGGIVALLHVKKYISLHE